ncbi:tetratricopeptide repeat protein [Candidatus Microgenomates bacterium]|nr:tetratricopeptide repeat protein [Candidatus Microgenomates bacterium]
MVTQGLEKAKDKFPSIYRRITEKKIWLAVASVVIGVAILIVGADLQKNIQKKQDIEKERVKIAKEIEYWEKTIEKYKDFRDAYFQLAVLNYRLGELEKAKPFLQKTLELDPNFEEGRELEKLVIGN